MNRLQSSPADKKAQRSRRGVMIALGALLTLAAVCAVLLILLEL